MHEGGHSEFCIKGFFGLWFWIFLTPLCGGFEKTNLGLHLLALAIGACVALLPPRNCSLQEVCFTALGFAIFWLPVTFAKSLHGEESGVFLQGLLQTVSFTGGTLIAYAAVTLVGRVQKRGYRPAP
jgi:hypothetical protein